MGFLDSLLGKTKLPQAKTEKLFAIATAAVTLETSLGYRPDGAAAVCIRPVDSSRYDAARAEVEELLKLSMKDTGTNYTIQKDEYNYVWAVLADPDFEDLVAGVQMVSQILTEHGFGTQLLAAVFRFRGEVPLYWIYNFKQGNYYPFVPAGGRERDTSRELRLKAIMSREMPIEKDESRWYPMWGMPL
ncbi:MAG TPA: hypothetical protein PLN19_07495 [Methanothrix sp.]|nr:hypothetical protein [Methanothrix sp.]HPC90348.1 hypothetical protein [Methanothrix sp.]HQE88098.1 hypothetical protein [Methanothrix sp.]HQI68717.1 hypothetical protein [Methanothrix sp.]HRS85776.1 hypothetical protein [Methanothrix sp.]